MCVAGPVGPDPAIQRRGGARQSLFVYPGGAKNVFLSPQRLMPGGGKSANLGYKDQRAVSYFLFRVISH